MAGIFPADIVKELGKCYNLCTVTFAHSVVLYLRCNESTPDKLKIITPGGDIAYDIPLMKSQNTKVYDRRDI